jgi:hypothetical protein
LLWKVTDKLIESVGLREPRLISNGCFWTLSLQINLDLGNVIVSYARVLAVISFVVDHRHWSISALSISIAALLDRSNGNIIVCITSSPACSSSAVVTGRCPVSFRTPKRILRTCLDIGLRNILLADDSFNLVISRARSDVRLQFELLKLSLRVLELAWQHHNRISLTLLIVPRLLDRVHLREIHLIMLIHYVFR